MIIACPACATRYVVPDSAIGPEGRTVRCAKCRHSWYQDGAEMVEPIAAAYGDAGAQEPAPRAAGPADMPAPPPEPIAAAPDADDRGDRAPHEVPSGVDASAPAAWSPRQAFGDPAMADEEGEPSPFDHAPPFRARRNWLRLATWGAGLFAALALAAVAAMAAFGTPSWLPIERPLFGSDPGLTVEFPASEQERRQLPNGAEFFGARVVVKNETRETKRVPPLLIVLRDARKRVVYSWELVPPQRTLAPGEAMTINEAMTDVPRSAHYADIGWAPR